VVNFVALLIRISLQILTVIHRHTGSVSPLLLHFSYISIYSGNVASTIYVVQTSVPIASDVVYAVLCQVFGLMESVGTTMFLGSLLVKSWRLYRIFVYYLNPGKFIPNKALILITFLLCLVDIVICTLWFIWDPIKHHYTEISRINHRRKYDIFCWMSVKNFSVHIGYTVFKASVTIPGNDKTARKSMCQNTLCSFEAAFTHGKPAWVYCDSKHIFMYYDLRIRCNS